MSLFGWIMCVSSASFLACYIPILLIFKCDPEFRGNTTYTIMLQLGITDILQLIVHFLCGVTVVCGATSLNFVANKIVGAIFTGLWYCMLFTLLFLHFNRFSAIVLQRYRIFTSKPTWFLLCLLNFIVPMVLKLLPNNNYVFDPTNLQWARPTDDNTMSMYTRFYGKIEIFAVVGFAIFGYSGIFLFMTINHGRKAFRGKEWKITLQISLMVVYFLFAIFYWYYLTLIVKIDPTIYNFFSALVWIFMNGLQPFIYLTFNRRLRNSFVHFFTHFSPRGQAQWRSSIFVFDREFRGNLAYIIMIQLGVLDVVQLVVHFYSGMLVTLGSSSVNPTLNKIVGAVFTGVWYSMLTTIMFLTYNRFSVIVLEKYRLFTTNIFKGIWFLVCFLNLAIPTILKCLPNCSYLFNPKTMKWVHPSDDMPLSNVMDDYGEYLLWTVVAFSSSGYAGVFVYMWIMHGRSAFRGKEWKITLQISLIIVYFLIAIFYWYYFTRIFTIDPLLFNFLSEIIWIMLNGLNPFIYLLFNRRCRKSFFHFLRTLSPRGEPPKSSMSSALRRNQTDSS